MRGHVERRHKSTYTIIIELGRDPHTGKRRRMSRGFAGTKREAEAEMRRWLHELETGIYIKTDNITFGEFLERWLEHAAHQVAPKTLHRYDEMIRVRVIPALGQIPLKELQVIHLQNFYSQLLSNGSRMDGKEGGLSRQTVLHHHRVIRTALGTAVDWQLVPRNVAASAQPPRPDKKEMQILTEQQVGELLALVRGTAYYMPILLAVTTGMRRGEIYGLRWQDVDFGGTITVKQSAQYTKKEGLFFKEPKTKKSLRRIAIEARLIEEMRRHRAEQIENMRLLGSAYKNSGLVICAADGSPVHPDSISKWFPIFLRENGLPSIRFHDLRHTHASILIKQGVHAKVISERLGHASVSITMDTYGHLLPGLQSDAASKVENAIFGAHSVPKMAPVNPSELH